MSSTSPELAAGTARGVEPSGNGSAPVEADLGWALGVVFRRYAKASAAALEGLPGGPRGYQVLATTMSEGPKRQLDLAAQLDVDRTVMTYLLDDLEKAELVQRRPDPADRRARLIVPTEQGKQTLCELERRLRATEEEVLGILDEPERASFRMLLQRVAMKANAIDPLHNACALAEAEDAADC
ncbi:MarR family winged helix-turn-helix transcriptional regulator [Kribbella solani]|uniref:DNA-binding MarR family transcriptional regulator n=1 Tax=Kribbella solani TaxID=236067 RepID=A0A841DM73_9ACTN|nr:MarR family transcriptional regulator [Kribbella solani]MBB5978809.1 DNA-binding MarR family transcriptional regulator [Kribbella solani]MDX2971815.1 MarR family transcriptional regulator [Kribbella solani]MDX3000471.1 MarR family transcriptional regulator [Kribbella solani]